MNEDLIFEYNADKNKQLKEERSISFEEIILHIHEGNLLDVIQHPNKNKYHGQKCYVVNVKGYVYIVPFVRERNRVFLKTIFPSRKLTRQYENLLERG